MLKLIQCRAYLGRNIHCDYAAVAGRVETMFARSAPLAASPLELQRDLVAALARFSMADHRIEIDLRIDGGDADILPARLAGWLAAGLQNLAGAEIDRHGVSLRRDGPYALSGYELAGVGEAAMTLACDLLAKLAAARDRGSILDGPLSDRLARFVVGGRERHFNDTTRALVQGARGLGIPDYRLSPLGHVVQLGQGVRRRQIYEAWSDRTPVTGDQMSRDKRITRDLLGQLGLPVPAQSVAGSLRQAQAAAAEIGYPVAVKPSRGMQGAGVSVDVRDEAELEAAYARALESRQGVAVIEKHIAGDDHRLLVVGGRFLSAIRRVRARVVGNGVDSVAALMATYNARPERGAWFQPPPVNDEMRRLLRHQGYTLDDIPADGAIVHLRHLGGFWRGGASVEVTDLVHPAVRTMADDAARALGLDLAGIDYITEDVGRPPADGGAICEVNGCPSLSVHWVAGADKRGIVEPVLRTLFPRGETGRIPTVAITGSAGKTTTTRMVAAIFEAGGTRTAVACSDGVTVGTRTLHVGDCAGSHWARIALLEPTAEAAVLEMARGGLIRRGIAIDSCDVAAVLNVSREHIGQDGIRTVEDLAVVKSMVLGMASRAVVLNADDPHCVRMAHAAGATPICWISGQPENPLLRQHVGEGGVAVTISGTGAQAWIVALSGDAAPTPLVRIADIPATWGGGLETNVRNALAAVAIAHMMDLPRAQIAKGLGGFGADFERNPGRYNLVDTGRHLLLLDRADAAVDMSELSKVARDLPVSGRRIVVLTHPGNRLDGDIRQTAVEAAGSFDLYVCYSWDDRRGRQPDEVPRLLAEGLQSAGVAKERIAHVPAQSDAITYALQQARAGDLLTVVCLDHGDALRAVFDRLVGVP